LADESEDSTMGTDVAIDLGACSRHSPCGHAALVSALTVHAAPASGTSVFARLLRGIGKEIDQGESLVGGALGVATGKAGSLGAELIALQVGVYRYGEALDLAARLVDRATGSIKSVLQGQ
jgi:hypothetical protein